jgi:RNA methyltransferase, TrmH family
VQAARRLLRRAGREHAGALLVEGAAAVVEALRLAPSVRELFVAREVEAGDLVARAEARAVPVVMVPGRVLAALSDAATPQGVVAVVEAPGMSLADVPADASLVVVLAEVRDPGNAGSLVRSAAASAADAVVFTRGTVDAFGPKTVRAAAGALWAVPVVRGVDLVESLVALRDIGCTIVGADASAPDPVDRSDLTRRVAIVLGNEAWGLPAAASSLLDERASIPMPGGSESLNVAIAGSIFLFEAVRQRRARARARDD